MPYILQISPLSSMMRGILAFSEGILNYARFKLNLASSARKTIPSGTYIEGTSQAAGWQTDKPPTKTLIIRP